MLAFSVEEIFLHRSMVSKSITAIGNSNCKGLHIFLECIIAARNSSNKPFGVKMQEIRQTLISVQVEIWCISCGPQHVQEQDTGDDFLPSSTLLWGSICSWSICTVQATASQLHTPNFCPLTRAVRKHPSAGHCSTYLCVGTSYHDARFYAGAVQLANWGALTRIILSGILRSKF